MENLAPVAKFCILFYFILFYLEDPFAEAFSKIIILLNNYNHIKIILKEIYPALIPGKKKLEIRKREQVRSEQCEAFPICYFVDWQKVLSSFQKCKSHVMLLSLSWHNDPLKYWAMK